MPLFCCALFRRCLFRLFAFAIYCHAAWLRRYFADDAMLMLVAPPLRFAGMLVFFLIFWELSHAIDIISDISLHCIRCCFRHWLLLMLMRWCADIIIAATPMPAALRHYAYWLPFRCHYALRHIFIFLMPMPLPLSMPLYFTYALFIHAITLISTLPLISPCRWLLDAFSFFFLSFAAMIAYIWYAIFAISRCFLIIFFDFRRHCLFSSDYLLLLRLLPFLSTLFSPAPLLPPERRRCHAPWCRLYFRRHWLRDMRPMPPRHYWCQRCAVTPLRWCYAARWCSPLIRYITPLRWCLPSYHDTDMPWAPLFDAAIIDISSPSLLFSPPPLFSWIIVSAINIDELLTPLLLAGDEPFRLHDARYFRWLFI